MLPPPAEKFRLALIQAAASPDPARNLAAARDRIHEAAARGAQVICLQELFLSPYFCQSEDSARFDLAEPIPGPSTEALSALARSLGVVLIAPLFERRAPGVCHNTAAVLDADGSLAGIYRKMHIPDDPLYHEKFYFTPGDLGYRVFKTRFASIGVLICWDQWYPEAARLTALQGAGLLLYPSAIGWHPSERASAGAAQYDAWRTIHRSHAIASGVFVAAVNRVGHEGPPPGLDFWGGSFACDPFGVVLAQASHDREEILLADCDLAAQENIRRHWPFLRDRRIDTYAALSQRFLD